MRTALRVIKWMVTGRILHGDSVRTVKGAGLGTVQYSSHRIVYSSRRMY